MINGNDTRSLKTFATRYRAVDCTCAVKRRAIVDDEVRRRLMDCPYAYFLSKVSWQIDEGALTLTGYVRTDCLKHALEALLRDMEHVKRIINDVQVVNSSGLSGVRSHPREHRDYC